jgi:hypothetical protein
MDRVTVVASSSFLDTSQIKAEVTAELILEAIFVVITGLTALYEITTVPTAPSGGGGAAVLEARQVAQERCWWALFR